MNILHIHEKTTIRGGAEVYISQLQKLLPRYGVETHWVGIEEINSRYILTEFGNDNAQQANRIKDVFQFLENFIREKNIELINIHNIFNPAIVRHCLQLVPVVKTCHSPVMVCPGKDKFWRFSEKPCTIPYGLHCFKHIYTQGCANRHPKRVIRAWKYVNFEVHEAASQYQRIVVMSDFIKQGMLECGVDNKQIICNPYFTNEIAGEIKVLNNAPIKKILFIGRLASSKGPHIMLQALSSLFQERADLHLQIIGDGNMKPALMQTVADCGIESKVTFSGWLEKSAIDEAIGDCYLVIFPSIYPEAFGIVGIEAMMQGKPVVGFDVGGVSTWLKDCTTGFLIPRGDVEKMRKKIAILLSDVNLYRRMSLNARKEALNNYIPQIHLKRLVDIYLNSVNL